MAFTFPTDSNNKAGAVRQNQGGTGFHIPIVNYSPDGISPISAAGKDIANNRESVSLEAGGLKTFYITQEPTVIDYLEWSTNGSLCRFEIAHFSDLENPFALTSPDGSNVSGYSPANIGSRGSGVFEIVEHNVEEDTYKYKLTRSLYFPKGLRIRVVNGNSTSKNAATNIIGRGV